jgi:trehalose 6-phosphate phosphatase
MTIDPFFMPRMFPVADPPEPELNWALFLDLDGTLLDLAQTPSAVEVPRELVADLKAAAAALGGALAIVSGRLLVEVDALLAPLKLPGAGEHGALIRMPDGTLDEIDARLPFEWAQSLIDESAAMKGVLIERKTHSVVAHFRRAPRYGKQLRKLAEKLIAANTASYEILDARMAVEIRPRTVTKARAVNRLMSADPFTGRKPVFVGDDVTDHDGFRAATAMGGIAIDVFERFAGRPGEVRHWLKSFADI